MKFTMMSKLDLFTQDDLPEGFAYPKPFLRIVELGLTTIEPWHVIEGIDLQRTRSGLNKRYPTRNLIPFARRQDNDDVACWQDDSNEVVYLIHDFASAGWEQRGRFESFYDWFRVAIEDMIEFDT